MPSIYTLKELNRIAIKAVRTEAKTMKTRARSVKWELRVGKTTSLIAYGQGVDAGEVFTVSIAI